MLFLPREKGQGVIEYILVLAFVASVTVAILFLVGPIIGNVFSPSNGLPSTATPAPVVVYLPILVNSPAPTVTPTPRLPDLVISKFNIIDVGQGTYQANVTVFNSSSIAVEYDHQIHNFHIGLYAIATGQELKPDTEPFITWGAQGAWFGAGQSRIFTQIFSANQLGGSGQYTFYAWADPWNMVMEPNDDKCTLPFVAGIEQCDNIAKMTLNLPF